MSSGCDTKSMPTIMQQLNILSFLKIPFSMLFLGRDNSTVTTPTGQRKNPLRGTWQWMI